MEEKTNDKVPFLPPEFKHKSSKYFNLPGNQEVK